MNLMNIAKSALATSKFQLRKHAPVILTTAGMALVTGATVLSGYQSLKLQQILDDHQSTIYKIEENEGRTNAEGEVIYSAGDALMDIRKMKVQTGIRLVKLYAPVAALEAAGLICIMLGHATLANRFTALAAAYTAVDEAFKTYRDRIVEDYGTQYDSDVLNGIHRTLEEIEVTDEKGKKKTETAEMVVYEGDRRANAYSRFFDESSKHWVKNAALNLTFLKGVQNMCNDRLLARKYLLLNEVYEMLGIPPTTAGSLVGWVVGRGRKNYVDFGIFDMTSAEKRAFVNGTERSILLNFNVDGPIYGELDNLK